MGGEVVSEKLISFLSDGGDSSSDPLVARCLK